MKRREAIRNVTLLFGGAITASTFGVLFEGCNAPEKKVGTENLFTAEDEELMAEIADIIIPQTSSPGAKAAGVGPFIAMMINECYPDDAQKVFSQGLAEVNTLSREEFKADFVSLTVEDKNKVIKTLADNTIASRKTDREKEKIETERNSAPALVTKKNEKKPQKTYFFALIRELTILGYFTSEIGANQSLAYLPIPGRYDSCTDLKEGQKAWAL